ncbi:tyrosine-type recombinase/integrase [Tardiphaga sp. 215_C5_N2_1]|uniref:tyrosine-type recombinase/integrase n=1 Tax=Tardiphaga sp. 215_C5_N2_1 TaxID=3240774 RepID=UPI003F8CA16B
MAGLTGKAIEQAKPTASRYEKPDSVAGLYLVVQPSGAKSWALRFRSPVERGKDGQRKAKKLTLGTLALGSSNGKPQIGQPLTLTQARMLATSALESVRQGVDPTATRRVEVAKAKETAIADNTVDAAMIEFLKRYKGKKKQGLRDSTRNLTATYFGLRADPDNKGGWKKTGSGVLKRWSGKSLASITKHDAIVLLDKLVDAGQGVTANRTLTVLKTFFAWCVQRDMLAASPVAVLNAVAEEHSRERILSDVELLALWRAAEAESYPFGKLMQMLALTGCRRDEVRNAPWSEFEMESASIPLPNGQTWRGPLWALPAPRTKNNRDHLLPLTPLTVSVLQSLPSIGENKLLFTLTGITPISGLSKAKRRLDEAMVAELKKIDPGATFQSWSPHDLRRTLYSGLQRLGFSIEVAEACVNHKLGGVAGVYGRHQYLAEKTAAFEAWSRHVDGLVNGNAGARS